MKVITVHKRTLCPLINSIIQRKHLPPHKRVIPIDQHHYLPWTTIIMYGVVNILQRKYIFLIYHYSDFILRNISLLYIPLNILPCFIWRCIVNINYMIILVLLHKNRVKISQIQLALDIIVRWRYYTKWQLLIHIFTYLILLLIDFLLCL